MFILGWCKAQIACLAILIYIYMMYVNDGRHLNKITGKKGGDPVFNRLFVVAELAVFFDGMTAWSVNCLELLPDWVNLGLHLGMFLSYEAFMFLVFRYWYHVTVGEFRTKAQKVTVGLTTAGIMIATTVTMPKLKFLEGERTNYSMGLPVYICFSSIILIFLVTIILLFMKQRYLPKQKKNGLIATLCFVFVVFLLEVLEPEALVSSIGVVLVILSIYLNMENPTIHALEHYHSEMVMGFANLVENRDDSTGGHIRRSSAYVKLIAHNLRKNPKYRRRMSKDYVSNLLQAAPMHDIGKIGIPDGILKKPGRLTEEEYAQMQKHSAIGGDIIQESFGKLFNEEYRNVAYSVARYHHEKWNGKGYPEGLQGTDIPLSARIMAVADVFDAVSEKRCYKEAFPLEECYRIIEEGSGKDFDPDIVEAFLMDKEKIEKIHKG